MPSGFQYTEENCEIVGMSVSEFVAKNEDFSENYDLIYIGASNDNMSKVLNVGDSFNYSYYDSEIVDGVRKYKLDGNGNKILVTGNGTIGADGRADASYRSLANSGKVPTLVAGDPIYNDVFMNGMYYTNVGDIIETANKEALDTSNLQSGSYVANPLHWGDMIKDLNNPPALGGMLKEDYFNWGDSLGINALKTQYIPLGGHASVRASGNDINQSTMERLEAYVQTGRPLIIDDKLISKGVHANLTVHLTASDLQLIDGVYHNTFTVVLRDENGDTLADDDLNLQYHWWRDNEDGTRSDLGFSDSNTYPGEFSTSGIVEDGTTLVPRHRKILGITTSWTEWVEVPKYKTVAVGLGDYYCDISFKYHGTTYSGQSNKVKIQMDPNVDRFVSRLYSDAYYNNAKNFWGNRVKEDFDDLVRVTYEVKFFKYTYDSNGYPVSETDVTNIIQDKYNVQYEWWDENKDDDIKCEGKGLFHTADTFETLRRILDTNEKYRSFRAYNYFGSYTNYCSKCKESFTRNWDLRLFDSNGIDRILALDTDINRAICRLTFTVGGRSTVFRGCKENGVPSEVFVSKSTGPFTKTGTHEDDKYYPYAELYSAVFHGIQVGNTVNHSGTTRNSSGQMQEQPSKDENKVTNYPEYEFQISTIDTHPVPSNAKTININTDSEANAGNIDNCSYMWRFLVGNYYSHRSNMFAYDDGLNDVNNSGNTSKLAKALQTPRPEIKNIKTNSEYAIRDYGDEAYRRPLARTVEDGKSVLAEDLTITFDLEEPTETFTGKYKAEVYLDSDGDGKFDEGELYSLAALTGISPNSTGNTITVQLNPESKGIVPWKLVVTEEDPPAGRGATHMSRTGYAYAKPDENDPIKINAAMVLPGAWDPSEWVKPTSGRAYDFNKSYLNILSEVAGPKRTIDVLGKPKQIEYNYWSENEYMGPVFASPVFDQLKNDPYASTVRMTQKDFEDEGITIVEWDADNVGGVDDGNNPLKTPLYHLGFKINGSDIQIMITCLSLHMLNTFYGITNDEGFGAMTWKCDNSECPHKNQNITGMYCTYCGSAKKKVGNQSDILQSYNMLILGFADSWGKLASSFLDIAGNQVEYLEGMSNYTALGIRNYIELDMPVLFCHDTTNRSVDFLDLHIDKLKQFGTTI